MIRQTHTYVLLEISDSAYQEIAEKLRKAGYDHVFMEGGHMDMQGIALAKETKENNE